MNESLNIENNLKDAKKLGYFEKLLPLWVAICIIIGILLSKRFGNLIQNKA